MARPAPSEPPGQATPDVDTARIGAQLRKWQERLLDLTKANPLLGINRSRVSKLQVDDPDPTTLFNQFVVGDEALRLPLVRKRPKVRAGPVEVEEESSEDEYTVEPGDIGFDAKPADVLRRLRRIYDNARTTVEERGVTTLHLALGVLSWDEPGLGDSESPLWMVPCQFEYSGPNAALRLQRADEEMQLNPALELYLRERQHVTLPPVPEELTSDDLARYLDRVRDVVREQGWTVKDDVWLSTFSFESLVIYQDLRALADVATKNPIVAALARTGTPPEGSEALAEGLDDLPTPGRVPVPVLPTDASQLAALTLAAGGRHLVIHGPPGTGKSQTISNLIADALGKRQKVLFVSAKMAALDVVHERLAEKGLGRFCLEAHSTKAGKAKIVEELKRTLESTGDGDPGLLEEQLEELRQVRGQLNDYVRQLHERREPLGLTVYQAIGKVAKLHASPNVGLHVLPWENPLAVSRADLRVALDLLDELAAQAAVFDTRSAHPWRGFTVESERGLGEEVLAVALTTVRESGRTLVEGLQVLSAILGPKVPELSLQAVENMESALTALAGCERLPSSWFRIPLAELTEAADLLAKAAGKATRADGANTQYDRIAAIPVADCHDLLTPLRGEFRSWTRILRPRFWTWQASVRRRLKPGTRTSLPALRSYLDFAETLVESHAWFQANEAELARLVGAASARESTALVRAAAEYGAAAHLRKTSLAFNLAPTDRCEVSQDIQAAARSLPGVARTKSLRESIANLDAYWPSGFVDGTKVGAAPLPALTARCDEVLRAFPRLHEWVLLCHALGRCREAGLGKFIEALGSTSARLAPAAFAKRFYTLWTSRAMEASAALRLFSPERRLERVERFRQLDDRIRELALRHLRAAAADPARSISSAQTNLGEGGEVGVLRRELQKRKRIKPLRKLFGEIPHALQALKPCMLMSPLSVSTFLKPGSVAFDLVVFDEASQLPTPQAIPAILRAKQVVVAGDEKQLPPTSFFEASVIFDEDGGGDDREEELEPLESLLDDCVAINPVFLPAFLAWHYRSRDERLINFSNHYFYNNALVTFPSATTSTEGRGIHHVYVPDGVWDRGRSRTNRREARRVAEVVIDQLRRLPDRSIGVVAMNTTQREAIEVALNEFVEQRPNLAALLSPARAEPFFIKSLENVQGDERDTMIISVGYAKAESGALSLNFGPLNRDGGWRRLNVLVTRAKWQTILVTSMRSQELAAVNPNNRGAFMLRKFIEYAEAGGALPAESATVTHAETNDFEEAVVEALRQCDLEVDEQVGVGGYRIDLAIRDPRDRKRYLLGVECDGATYHSARTARDRDLLRQQVLRNQGWRLHRLWSTDWFRGREKALQGVLRSVELAQQAPPDASVEAPAPPPPSSPSRPGPTPERQAAPAGPVANRANRQFAPGRPYRRYRPARRLDSEGIMDRRRVWELASCIAEIVRFEGPVHEEVLLDRLKEVYDVARAKSRIQENVGRATAIAQRQHGVRHDSARRFLYAGSELVNGFRIPGDGVQRTIGQVPPEEITAAVLYIVEDQFGFPREHLPRAVAELLDLGRTNAGVSEAVGDVADGLIERGQLRLSGPNVYLP